MGPVSWSRSIRSHKDLQEFQDLVDDLEKRGIVEPSTSVWLNPVVIIRKKTGEMRFCIDLRRLNEIVENDSFEIPKISEMFVILRGMKYFSVIDLKMHFLILKYYLRIGKKQHSLLEEN
jgi:hypothetical protein